MDETVLIKVQEDGSRVVESSINKVADATDKAGVSAELFQKIMGQMTSVMDRVASSMDRLNAMLDKQTTSAKRVADAQDQTTKSTDALTKAATTSAAAIQQKVASTTEAVAADNALAESETVAASRIQAMVAASLEHVAAQQAVGAATAGVATAQQAAAAAQTAAGVAAKGSADGYTASASAAVAQMLAVEGLNDVLDGGIKNIGQWRDVEGQLVAALGNGTLSMSQFQQMTAKLDAQLPNLTASINKEAAGVDALIKKYDPLSVKSKQLAADEIALQKARDTGIIGINAYNAASAGIAAEQKAVQDAVNGVAPAMEKLNFSTAGARAELGRMLSEAASGRFDSLERSSLTLGSRVGLLQKAFSVTGASILLFIGILAALVVGVIKGYEEFQNLNKALIVTGNTSGVTAGQVSQLADSMATTNVNAQQTNELFTALIGTGRATSDSFNTIGKAAQNMLALTGQSVDQVAASFDKLYDDPIKWADDMDTKFHFLTLDVRDHAQALEDAGNKYGAAEIVAAAFADNTKAKIDQLNASMGTLDRLLQQWQSGVSNIKGFVFNIGKPEDAVSKFQDAKKAYEDFVASATAGGKKLSDSSGDLYTAQILYARLQEAQQLAMGERNQAAADKAADQQRQAMLAAGKNIDSVNDKTQKQITLQTKLNELADSYKKLHETDPNNARLAGVSFDAQGTPSGGGYASKQQELITQTDGAPKKPKVDNTAFNDWKKYYDQLTQLQATIDPTTAAMGKLTDAQDLLTKAVQMGDLTQQQADYDFALYQAQLADTINPVQALTKKLDDQLSTITHVGDATKAGAQAQKDANDLLKQGIVLTDQQKEALTGQYQAIEKATAQQQLLSRIGKSVLDQNKDMINTLTVLQQLQAKGPGNGGISADQAQQYLVKENPDIYANTQDLLNSQLALYQSYYAKIDALAQAGYLSQSGKIQATANVDQKIQNLRLQGTTTFLNSLSTLQNSQNKKAAAVGKAAAISSALINTYQAATGAFSAMASIPYVGPFLGAAAAAAAVVAGLANVAQIRSTNPGFMAGGYTGNGGIADVAGVVHGKEYVMDAATTSRIGVRNLDALRSGAAAVNTPPTPSAATTTNPNNTNLNVKQINVFDKSIVGDYITGEENEQVIVNTMDRLGYKRS